jgi:hypothetical protein
MIVPDMKREQKMTDIIERLRRWCHDVYAQSAQDLMEEAATEIEQLRRDARYWRAMHEHNSPEPQWMDRSQVSPSDPTRQCLLYTDKLEGFIWIGRKGVLPADVSHWMYLPAQPSAGRSLLPEAAKNHPAGS